MRVLDRKSFLACPAGTIYAKGVPWAFQSLCIKGDSLESNDWCELDPTWIDEGDNNAHNILVAWNRLKIEEDFL